MSNDFIKRSGLRHSDVGELLKLDLRKRLVTLCFKGDAKQLFWIKVLVLCPFTYNRGASFSAKTLLL